MSTDNEKPSEWGSYDFDPDWDYYSTRSGDPRCGGGRTNCRHDQRPPLHSMACPISRAAALAGQGENRHA